MKVILWIVGLVLLIGGGYLVYSNYMQPTVEEKVVETQQTQQQTSIPGGSVVTPGSYVVATSSSQVKWAGRKPLISGYVNSGHILLSGGDITVTDTTATGMFTLDMNTLTVDLTAKKPGKESALQEHLKKGDFFDVTKFPTASFKITSVTAQADSNTSFNYTVKGDLTMKGVTNEITFPAKIYMKDGSLVTEATTAIDRTKWNITFGSSNFFDNLADNAIDDMVTLDFSVVATKK